jgi:putative transposase
MLWSRAGARAQSRLHSGSFASGLAGFLLEAYRLRTGVSWYEAKAAILREAIRRYLAHLHYVLQPTA